MISLGHEGGRLQLTIRRGVSPDAPTWREGSIDATEGLLAYLLIVAVPWVSASVVAGSHWLPRSDLLPAVCLAAAVAGIVLAKLTPRGSTYWLAMEVGAVAALFVATAGHHGLRVDRDFHDWVLAMRGSLMLGLLVSMVGAAWFGTAWLVFWTLRRRNVLVGLAPFALVMAIEVIDDSSQKGLGVAVAGWIVLAVALAIRIHLAGLVGRWGTRASDEVSFSLGVHGARVLAVILVIGFLVPPLSRVDISSRLWGSHGSGQATGTGTGPGTGPGFVQTGYTERVEPGGTLVRSQDAVLEVANDLTAGVYWRGIDLYAVGNGVWETGESTRITTQAPAGADLETASYQARQQVHGVIRVVGVPERTIFWPGDPIRASVASQIRGDANDVTFGRGSLAGVLPVDGVYSINPVQPGDTYTVDASYSVATEEQLRSAGTGYPASIQRLAQRRPQGGRNATIDPRVSALAQQVSGSAGTPYDQARAIETYLRQNLKYQLQVNTPPGTRSDPVSYFLFESKTGYCEYFASAMGEMVRSLGLPVRLVNGYGPGSQIPDDHELGRFNQTAQSGRVIRAADAHTWVEVFFPNYGWIPFEPTPDPNYPALAYGVPPAAPATQAEPVAPAAPAPGTQAQQPQGVSALVGPAVVVGALAIIMLGLLVLARAVARGRTRLSDVQQAWRRLGWLATRLGVRKRASETPLEFTARLGAALPPMRAEIDELGRAYSGDCYRAGGLAARDLEQADVAWRRLRAVIVRTLVLGTVGSS